MLDALLPNGRRDTTLSCTGVSENTLASLRGALLLAYEGGYAPGSKGVPSIGLESSTVLAGAEPAWEGDGG